MDDSLTKEGIMKAIELAREYRIEPCVVKTRREARQITKSDPVGKKWKKGDKYYFADSLIDKNIIRTFVESGD